ncbi:DNA ligase D [Sphingomonas sabuli]|uniref:DNA ligase (ATP) n=1 Tax=Sphingomonas sabuli TaxID=2764186 RepID=A0A7G9L1G6_9SPHN|nr:DNA ligase D [Sphingomonas sabuli]QNM82465.1 DNA ligase D [Sphingomonas sabuli]
MARASKTLDIKTYNAKRDFSKTKEPKGRKLKGTGDSFVVQKHEASRLHWDFRLELDGVLKSWAVPKGPSLDPGTNRLAMRTEDHPLDYGTFEGTIPEGEYGGGTVMLWDRGRWIPHPDKDPSKTIEEGHLHFTLEGERMKGEWVMFRMKAKPGEKGEAWMLKKVTDDEARADDGDALVDHCTDSVTTGRTMAEIASGSDVWKSNRGGTSGGRTKKAPAAAPPEFQSPQKATLVDDVPTGPGWLFEYKYDGYRLLLATGDGAVTAWTRNGKDWSDKFRSLAKAAEKLPPGCLIDGEAVALTKDGKPDFQLLQSTLKDGKGANLAYYAFDLLVDRGEDITKLPNIERKMRLQTLLKGAPTAILYGDHIDGKGEALFNAVCKDGGEGIIAKKADAPYRHGRSKSWLKIKCIERQEFVVVGWVESDRRIGFRSLLLAAKDKGKLSYVGKVGTGFNTQMLHDLMELMKPLEVKAAPVEIPRTERKGAHFIKPQLVAEVAFTEFTSDNILRHPSFIALRDDKPASEVVVETPADLPKAAKAASTKAKTKGKSATRDYATPESLGVRISSTDRAIFPTEKLTKGDLAAYYAAIGPLIMPDSGNRPITLIRCPQGRAKKCFFQKHDTGSMGDFVKQVEIREKKGGTAEYLCFDDIRGLLGCVQMGTIEFHGWGSRADNVEHPDRLVFDLDPDEGLKFADVRDAARRIRDLLKDMGLETFPMLTGGKGVHVVAPLDASADWDAVTSFAERFARAVAEAEPEMFTANMRKVQRKGRIFLDWLRNQRGSTAVMPYSARAREGAPVAVPVAWAELDDFKGGNAFTIRDVDRLFERAESNALKGWGDVKQALPEA